MTFSILICSLEEREALLARLLATIPEHPEVEVLVEVDNKEITTGAKRNKLLERAKGKYVAFVDDDDILYPMYVPEMLAAMAKEPDAIGFKGWITWDGRQRKEWRISKNYTYEQRGNVLYRYNNHLSPIRRELAMQIKFKDLTFGEDTDYAHRLHEAKLVKTEVFINKFLYHYDYTTKK